ncbi:MAG TPA: type I secretion system permease/ATPase [Burkholderiales bacterium]|nr:type I secretion system permease/ATPase [Burkholderiales bacterium]
MRNLVGSLLRYFAYAGAFSLAINVLLLVPALYMLQVFDRVLASRSEETLVMLSFGAVLALAMMSLLDVLRAQLLAACGLALDRSLGPDVLRSLLALTARTGGAEHLNGLRDVATLRGFLVGAPVIALFDTPWLPLFLALIWLFHPLLGILAIGGALLMLGLAWANERFTRQPLERVQAESRRSGRFIDAAVRSAESVDALGMREAVTRRWSALNETALREQREASRLGALFSGLTKFARQAIQMTMLGAGAWLVISQNLSSGVMIACTIILGRALAPVEMLVGSWRSLVDVRGAWLRLTKLFESRPAAGAPATELPAPSGAVAAEGVMHMFPRMERPVLRGVAFALPAGESLGVIGPTAAGKSTLAKLLVGIWKPTSGAVRLDGVDVAAWDRAQLGPHVGYVPQTVELFGGTIADNIARLGEPDSAAVVRAAQRAYAHDMILRLPKGYDTETGNAGEALSPGQRQRVALARALYGEPRLVVLDEPNANLDADGDDGLLRALQGMKQAGVTVIIVAHRPSLLAGVDKLLVLKDGVMELYGPRAEIMARVTRAATQVRGVA